MVNAEYAADAAEVGAFEVEPDGLSLNVIAVAERQRLGRVDALTGSALEALATARGAAVGGLVFCVLAMRTLAHANSLQHNFNLDTPLRNAVLDAFIAVFDMIRERTALQLDGADLVGRAFSLSEPRLIVSELDTESGRSDQKGFIQILQGVYLGVRNPKAHSLRTDLDTSAAAQYLVFGEPFG